MRDGLIKMLQKDNNLNDFKSNTDQINLDLNKNTNINLENGENKTGDYIGQKQKIKAEIDKKTKSQNL